MIAVLCVAAFILIVIVLKGSDFDETSGRALATAIAVAFFSLTGLAGTSLAARRPQLSAFGFLTAILSFAAFLAVAATVWSEHFQDDSWKLTVDLGVLALAAGHASLLLGSAREGDSDTVGMVRTGVLSAIAALCLMTIIEVSSEGRDFGAEPFGVVAVLYLLGTALIPLLTRIEPSAPESSAAAEVQSIDRMLIAVSDRARSDSFYRDALGAEVVPGPDGRFAYRFGSQALDVYLWQSDDDHVRPGGSRICLVWDGAATAAVEHLQGRGIAVAAGPVAQVGARGIGTSVFCRDPDGSLIELISYT